MPIIVRTKDELKKAIERKDKEIIVEGDLADEVIKAKNIKNVSKGTLITLGGGAAVAIAAVPFTGGASLLAFAGTAAVTTGLSTVVILAALAIGGLLIAWAIYNDYDVEISYNPTRVILKKK